LSWAALAVGLGTLDCSFKPAWSRTLDEEVGHAGLLQTRFDAGWDFRGGLRARERATVVQHVPINASTGNAEQTVRLHGVSDYSGCGMATTVSWSIPLKSLGLHVYTGRPFATAVAAIIAS
jgi:hypothetical protein